VFTWDQNGEQEIEIASAMWQTGQPDGSVAVPSQARVALRFRPPGLDDVNGSKTGKRFPFLCEFD